MEKKIKNKQKFKIKKKINIGNKIIGNTASKRGGKK
jgi:hypothetical protein